MKNFPIGVNRENIPTRCALRAIGQPRQPRPGLRAGFTIDRLRRQLSVPLYSSWFKDFSKQTPGIAVDYQAKGSGAGIQDFINNTVDFAASDAAMEDGDIAKVKQGVVLLPMTAGEIVLSYNLEGVKELKLPRDVYVDIFAGKIAKWSDPKIAAANPGVKFPDQNITVVARSDSSGTTYVFTGHLSAVSEEFKKTVGHGTTAQWPTRFVKAPKNDGVTATIKQTPGATGYIEYTYAMATKQPMAVLQNKAGQFVTPSDEAGKAALASAEFPNKTLPGSSAPDLRVWLFDPSGEQSYPITTFTWMLFYQDQDDAKAKVLRDLVEYGLTQGQAMAPKKMKDAAYGMGCTRTQIILKVVLPTGASGILTGVMLAIAGAAGNSAPLLFTACLIPKGRTRIRL